MAKRRPRSGPTFIGRSRQVSSEEKASYHNVLGAGRRGTIRRFFDLNTEDQRELRDKLEHLVEGRIRT